MDPRSTPTEWLRSELPALQRQGVIDAATAERIRLHYADAAAVAGDANTRRGWGSLIAVVLAAVLIGLGVLLLVAHNWDALSRPVRLALSFAPLLLGQVACGALLWRDRGQPAWNEAAAVFTLAGVAAALALVGQMFHFSGDLHRYLLTCALLALPLVYALNASLLAVLTAALFSGWAVTFPGPPALLTVMALFALLIPHVVWSWQRAPQSLRARTLVSVGLPLLAIAIVASLTEAGPLAAIWLMQVAAILWLTTLGGAEGHWRRSLPAFAVIGVLGPTLWASSPAFWTFVTATSSWSASLSAWTLVVVTTAATLGLALKGLREGRAVMVAGALPAMAAWLAVAVDLREWAVPLALLTTLYLLGLGTALIREGVQRAQHRIAHLGLAVLTALILLRFFDTQLSFTLRGMGFLVLGLAFLAAHLWLRRRLPT